MTLFSVNREIGFGDLLTPLSILIALLALLHTWREDRDLRSKQYADNVRGSASVVTAKLERWGTLSDRYFDDIQHALIVASRVTAATHQPLVARRDLFDAMKDAEGKASQRIVDEQLEISYMELYRYIPSLRPPFDKVKTQIGNSEKKSHDRLEQKLQIEDLFNQELLKSSDSKDMGNALRRDVQEERERLHMQIQEITEPLRENIVKLINLNDEELLDPHTRASVTMFDNER